MAKYHESLKYHEDTTEKVSITKEDIEFLKELQNELNTQDNLAQADPRFWVIKGSTKIYHVEDYDGEELIYDGEVVVANTMKEACDYINNNLIDDIKKENGYDNLIIELHENLIGYDEIYISETDECLDEILVDMQDVVDWLKLNRQGNYQSDTYKIIPKIYENTMFLTQIDAENHLRSNHYHYSEDAHTYAMTAWRSPRVERVIKLLQTLNFDDMRKGENND